MARSLFTNCCSDFERERIWLMFPLESVSKAVASPFDHSSTSATVCSTGRQPSSFSKRSSFSSHTSGAKIRHLLEWIFTWINHNDVDRREWPAECHLGYENIGTARYAKTLLVGEAKSDRHARASVGVPNRERNERNVFRLIKGNNALNLDFFFGPNWR